MRRVALTLFLCAAGSSFSGQNQQPETPPLTRPVGAFTTQNESRLAALVRLGRENGLRFGLEFLDEKLIERIRVQIPATQAGAAVKGLLGSANDYTLSWTDGVILIRKNGVLAPGWLDQRLPRFSIRRMPLDSANANLWMAFEMSRNPARKGFAGDSPPGDPTDRIGPLDVRGATMRDLLCRIVGSSKGSAWIVTNPAVTLPGAASVNQLWTLMFSGPPLNY